MSDMLKVLGKVSHGVALASGATKRMPSSLFASIVPLTIRQDPPRTISGALLVFGARSGSGTSQAHGVDHALRLCRHCRAAVEDPVHVVLVCTARRELTDLRASFWAGMMARVGLEAVEDLSCLSPKRMLQYLTSAEGTVDLFARFVRYVLRLFDAVPFVVV
ncbi:hypothetical protein AURDEDRAFT_168942 [Auricularia subglabra TFB-10046 SS5]|nr:hypothetical protein AURDEDRAFT_168942 [Auricularia subglabra TFB-10046 SS5]